MSVLSRPVSGHGLVAEGAAFSASGGRSRWDTVAGKGYALCACGALSETELPSAASRKRWHRAHKWDALYAKPPQPEHPDNAKEIDR